MGSKINSKIVENTNKDESENENENENQQWEFLHFFVVPITILFLHSTTMKILRKYTVKYDGCDERTYLY